MSNNTTEKKKRIKKKPTSSHFIISLPRKPGTALSSPSLRRQALSVLIAFIDKRVKENTLETEILTEIVQRFSDANQYKTS